ncbi:hypothetical protein [Nannocystis bainbridge]|uniref:Uncharacterized protein n=1 Tax=Nannocystis bainbridge TaxID=2995303 RepID=A0ABT5E6P4_9BACT|nr:hypothetical protein [Nannocystis bainbridge]MDC0720436.1 hypothetical protein [Nannocystis bainbridge]
MRDDPLAGFFTADAAAILRAQDRLTAADEPARARVVGPGGGSLVALIDATVRLRRLLELGAPPIVGAYHRSVVQQALQAVLAAWGASEPPAPTLARELPQAGRGPTEVPVWPVPQTWDALVEPAGLAFAGPGSGGARLADGELRGRPLDRGAAALVAERGPDPHDMSRRRRATRPKRRARSRR